MSSILATVADAVCSELNSRQFAIPFDPIRSYADWKIELAEDPATRGKLFCDVVPVSPEVIRLTRDTITYHCPIHICFRKLLDPADREADGRIKNTAVDCLLELAESVFNSLVHDTILEAMPAARLEGFEWVTAYGRLDSPQESLLRVHNQFTSVIQMTYEVGHAS